MASRSHKPAVRFTKEKTMRRKIFVHSAVMLLVSIMFICFNSSPSAAQDYLGSLRVQVRDFYTGKPLSGATILVTPNNYTATSNAQGEAVIEKITPYRITSSRYSAKDTFCARPRL